MPQDTRFARPGASYSPTRAPGRVPSAGRGHHGSHLRRALREGQAPQHQGPLEDEQDRARARPGRALKSISVPVDGGPAAQPARTRSAGTCWVMQWMLPPPSSTSRVVDAHDGTVGEQPADHGRGLVVTGRVESRHHDPVVGEVEVDVAGRQAARRRGGPWCPGPARSRLPPRRSWAGDGAGGRGGPRVGGRGRRWRLRVDGGRRWRWRAGDRRGRRSRSGPPRRGARSRPGCRCGRRSRPATRRRPTR